MLDIATRLAARLRENLDDAQRERWLASLQARGMHIGEDVLLPDSTVIDEEYCYLISISDSCSLAQQVMLLAHEDLPLVGRAVTRVGAIILHASCHLGAGVTVLPGVTIGPRTVVAARSVVRSTLPPNSVCAGDPARPFSSLDQYLATHRSRLAKSCRFDFLQYDLDRLTVERRAEVLAAVKRGDVYLTGGRSAELAGIGGSPRTPTRHHTPAAPEPPPAS